MRQQLRSILKDPIEDVRLLQEISDVVMMETEHDSKLRTKATSSTVNQLQDKSKEKKGSTQPKPSNPIIAEITKLVGEVEKIKQELGNVVSEVGADGSMGRGQVLASNPAGVNGDGVGSGQVGGRGQGRGGSPMGRGGRNGGLPHSRGPGNRLGCEACKAFGLLCQHCFACGEDGHRFFDPCCPKKQKNDSGLQE